MSQALITAERSVRSVWRDGKSRLTRLLYAIAPRTCFRWRNEWRLRRKLFAEPEIYLVPRFCTPSSVAVDVGASVGTYTYVMSKHARSVHVFEPNPAISTTLKRRVPHNVEVHQVALSNRAGRAELRMPVDHALATIEPANLLADVASEIHLETVPTDTLDSFHLSDVSFIKIDVEGHELAVVEGAANTISRWQPVLQIEIEDRHAHHSFHDMQDLLRQFGYAGYFLEGSKFRTISEFRHSLHQNTSNLASHDLQKDGQYINNFIFVNLAQRSKLQSFWS